MPACSRWTVPALLLWATAAYADEAARAEAGKVFQQRCINCHQPPDVNFATDRAWLDQINRTA
jgi:mono/diheme cytochrome c family protein